MYKFLKKNRLLEDFINEVCHQKPSYTAVVQYKQNHNILDFFDVFHNIDHALYWRDTTQGHDFWSKMHVCERQYLRQQNLFKNS